MDRVVCPKCEYTVGLGMACDPGRCPECDLPLMLTCEMRALSSVDIEAEIARQRRLEEQRRLVPLV